MKKSALQLSVFPSGAIAWIALFELEVSDNTSKSIDWQNVKVGFSFSPNHQKVSPYYDPYALL